jgi:hypothetical protein
MHNSSIVHRAVLKNGKKSLWWVAWSCSLLWLKNLIRVSDLDQTLQQQSIRHLCADVTIFAWTIALQEILALPPIIFDLHCGHKIEPFFAFSLSPNRLKPRVTSRQNSQ